MFPPIRGTRLEISDKRSCDLWILFNKGNFAHMLRVELNNPSQLELL